MTKWNGKIHEAAEMFPYLDDENFALLVESVRLHGIREPIVLTPDGTLIDGRNRALAAQEAGIEPPTWVEVGDPLALIRDANLRRRHMATGQQAMIEALLLVLEGRRKNGRWEDGSVRGRSTAVKGWEMAMKHAGTVIDHAPDLVDAVINGEMKLDSAYNEAKSRKKAEEAAAQEEDEEDEEDADIDEKVDDDTEDEEVDDDTEEEEEEVPPPKTVTVRTTPTFNSTNENISWAHWSWNPVTGCEHGCPYCYARELAESLQRKNTPGYEKGFEPAFHEYRLGSPSKTKFPADSDDDRDKRVFVCSMADLFGRWVPQEWIDRVFEACHAAPHWEYLFLTKFPNRYPKLTFPPNSWAGTSVDSQKRVVTAMKSMEKVKAKIRWLSIEPMLEAWRHPEIFKAPLALVRSRAV